MPNTTDTLVKNRLESLISNINVENACKFVTKILELYLQFENFVNFYEQTTRF